MLIPAIGFQGNCDDAITYYKEILGAEIKRINYARDADPDMGMDLPPNFVMYSEVAIHGTTFMMSDGMEKPLESFWMLLTFDTPEEVTAIFNKLAEGGEIVEPLAPQFYASLTGDVRDRFGVLWSVSTSS